METYSHSRISAFEQCPLKYKFTYIDGIVSTEKSIEAFLGRVIHTALEWLYIQVKEKKLPALDDVILYYANKWHEEYNEEIVINGTIKKEEYFEKGIKFIIDYYYKNTPFDDNTLEVEKEILVNLDAEGKYKIKGFIDRLAYNLKTGEYEIHDYKTSSLRPSVEKIQRDRQLALYSLALKDLFGNDKKILLVWHYLAYNEKFTSKRTKEELDELKDNTIKIIIESEKEYLPCVSRLCNWCEYKKICPAFGNSPSNTEKFKKESQKEIKDFEKWI
jgi:putative RecB family exonuclease